MPHPSPNFRFWRAPRLHDLELLHAWNIDIDYPRHLHEEHSIGVQLAGVETTIFAATRWTARAGAVILINAEEPHANASAGSAYRILKIKPAALNAMAMDIAGCALDPRPFREAVVDDRSLYSSLFGLHVRLERNLFPLQLESELLSAVAALLERQVRIAFVPPRTGGESHSVRVVRDYLRAHYARNVSLGELSSMTSLSRYHLLRVFRKHVGLPPHEYQTQVRVAHARRLIRGGRSIAQIATDTGFFDQSHLARTFKRVMGMTPGQYASQSKIVQDQTGRSA